MRAVLVWIKNEYNNPDVYVTENGFSDKTGRINDADRVDYYKYYINNVMQGKGFHQSTKFKTTFIVISVYYASLCHSLYHK